MWSGTMQARLLLVSGRARRRAEQVTQARPYGLLSGRAGMAAQVGR
jgi:hypothetical protein